MLANNEVGSIQPLKELSKLAHRQGAVMHTDAVQAGAWLDLSVDEIEVDLLSLSGHKFYGPKGVGMLYIREGTPMVPVQTGGGQERGLRSGTENTAAIVGAARAFELAHERREEASRRVAGLRDRLVSGLLTTVPDARLTGHPTRRLPNSAAFAFAGVDSGSLLMGLDLRGICASSGSACNSGQVSASHVLQAMRIPSSYALGALRLTLGKDTTTDDVEAVLAVLPDLVHRLRLAAVPA
jgi:cysteine desulfurase